MEGKERETRENFWEFVVSRVGECQKWEGFGIYMRGLDGEDERRMILGLEREI